MYDILSTFEIYIIENIYNKYTPRLSCLNKYDMVDVFVLEYLCTHYLIYISLDGENDSSTFLYCKHPHETFTI